MVDDGTDTQGYAVLNKDAEFVKAGIKGLIGGVPIVGALLNEVLFEAMGRVHLARLKETLREVAERVERLEQGDIDKDRMKTEEFADFVEILVIEAIHTRSREKRAIFADLLVASIHKDAETDYDFAEEYVELLARISEPEMIILDGLYRYAVHARKRAQEGVTVELHPIDYKQENLWGVPSETFRVCFDTLVSKGLVFDDSFGRHGPKPRTFIMPTQLAVSLLDFVVSSQRLIGSTRVEKE